MTGKAKWDAWNGKKGTANHCNPKSKLKCLFKVELEGSEQERSLDFLAIFESVHMPKFNYFWTLSKMAEKSRDRSCSEPFNCKLWKQHVIKLNFVMEYYNCLTLELLLMCFRFFSYCFLKVSGKDLFPIPGNQLIIAYLINGTPNNSHRNWDCDWYGR